jgi:probable phosphoglycerate mutase
MTETRVVVVRHGQAESNVPPLWTSAHDGYPLTELGHEQARTAGEALRGRGVVAVYGSRIQRAQQTAAAIAAATDLEPRTLPGVEEIDVGVHEGGHNDEVGPIAVEIFGRWWRHGDLDHGFEGGESGRSIATRMRAALDQVAAAHAGATSVVVSHGGAMAVGLTELCPELTPAFVSEHFLPNVGVVELVLADDGWHCLSWDGLEPA